MPLEDTSDLAAHEEKLLGLLEALERFEQAFKLRRKFNLFEALNITRHEIRHSRFLAYLLDPRETHALGDKFLRAILRTIVRQGATSAINQLAVELKDLSTASVYCERDHFDISVQIPELNLLFVIENKIDAQERESQLEDYRKHARERYSDYEFIGCFLTPDGYDGADENWRTLSYGTLCVELNRVCSEETMDPEVAVAVKHYIDLIQRRIMPSQALIDACRDIYMRHRAAFDLIVEHGQQPALGSAFERFASSHPEIEMSGLRSNDLYFHHRSWLRLPDIPQAKRETNWTSDFPIRFWFWLKESGSQLQLRLYLQVGPLLNPVSENQRDALVATLSESFNKSKPPRGKMYARIVNSVARLNEDYSVEELADAMEDTWKRLGGEIAADQVRSSLELWARLGAASVSAT